MREIANFNKTKIIATVGPACSSKDMLLKLAREGVDVFRLNFSHGTHQDHLQVIENVQFINYKYGQHLSLLADLQGPKLRIGKIEGNGLELKKDDVVLFTNKECVGTMEHIYMNYLNFSRDVNVGEQVLVDDGKLVFEVIEISGEGEVKLKVLYGGVLSSNKGVNLPNTNLSLPSLTEKDIKDLDFILTQPFNWIALSFVRSHKDMIELRERVLERNHGAKLIAKIEKPEAIEKIDKIIKHSNAIMVARGDLGIEVPLEKLPRLQKEIINKCIQRARPVIVATQMLDSMITDPMPTRAEISDVANAVFDGTDAVMLSGETSVGAHPLRVVEAMSKIIAETEQSDLIRYQRPKPSPKSKAFISDVVCLNAAKIADQVSAKAIIGMTSSGYTAFKVSSYRPTAPIYIFSDKKAMLATLNLVWGVRTFYYDKFTTTDETFSDVTNILKQNKCIAIGDPVINLARMPLVSHNTTNTLKLSMVD